MLMSAILELDPPRVSPRDPAADEPERSTILFQLLEGDSVLFREPAGVEFGEFHCEGKDAFWAREGCILEDAVAYLLWPDREYTPGWFVMEGFEVHYSKDYWGEVDVDYECAKVRPARWSDLKHFGGLVPWWGRALLWLGLDAEIPESYAT